MEFRVMKVAAVALASAIVLVAAWLARAPSGDVPVEHRIATQTLWPEVSAQKRW